MINFGVGVVAAGLAGVVLTRECIDLSPSGYINPILSWYVNKTLDHQEDRKGWNLRTPRTRYRHVTKAAAAAPVCQRRTSSGFPGLYLAIREKFERPNVYQQFPPGRQL